MRWGNVRKKIFFRSNQYYLLGIRLYGKNWKKVTQHVATRISAQVRSHAQKVLKDYSPNNLDKDDEEDGSKSEMTDQINNEAMKLPKDRSIRTEEPKFSVEGIYIRPRVGSNECLQNLNRGHKRYRN